MRWFRLAPVTAESLMICVAIYASSLFQASTNHQAFDVVQRSWGAIQRQEQSAFYDGVRREKQPELQGPFDIWDGEWWRIPLAPFHHADFLHLLFCVGGTWYLGSRLERCWGSFGMGCFMLLALCIPVLAELVCGGAVRGFSGVMCALLGAVIVTRSSDQKLAEAVSESVCEFGMATILLSWLATLTGGLELPNAGHLTGFVYGAATAGVISSKLKYHQLLRLTFFVAHLWLIPGLYFVLHPFWIGRYHWYRAITNPIADRAERSLEKAITYDSHLAGAWLHWSQMAVDRENPILAWRRILLGLRQNPSNPALMDGSRRIWRHLSPKQRRDAQELISEIFGKRSQVWLEQIRANSAGPEAEPDSEAMNYSEAIDTTMFKLDQHQELPRVELSPIRLDRLEPKQQLMPKEAAEGETL